MKPRTYRFPGVWPAVLLAAASFAPASAAMLPGARGDGIVDLYVGGRDLIVRTDGAEINGFILTSEAGLLVGEPYAVSLGLFATHADALIADQLGYALDGVHDLGRVLAADKPIDVLREDLTLTYTRPGHEGFQTATILPAMPGDADVDGDIGRLDLLAIVFGFGQAEGLWIHGDFDCTGAVDVRDYLAWKANVGLSTAPPGEAPEPLTLGLLALGAAGSPLRRRQTR